MADASEPDFGPLKALIGEWRGADGLDTSPDPDGEAVSPYHEVITFDAVGGVTNAKAQTLAVLRYHQVVTRKTDQVVYHDEMGYWMWDAETSTVMQSLVIPRGVSILAGGTYAGETDTDGRAILNVQSKLGNETWGIVQSPFMMEKAKTTEFRHNVIVGNGKLSYSETMVLDIYGKVFEHTDANELTLV